MTPPADPRAADTRPLRPEPLSTRPARLARPLLGAAGVLAAFALVGLVDPHRGGLYPGCPWLALTGTYCPACGGLRAANDLAHGDVSAAFGSNALLVVALPVLAACWARWVARRARGGAPGAPNEPFPQPSARLTAVLAALAMAFMVVRNTGFGAALAP